MAKGMMVITRRQKIMLSIMEIQKIVVVSLLIFNIISGEQKSRIQKYNRNGCRPEDFQAMSAERGICRRRRSMYAAEAVNSGINCSDEEFQCRLVYRCVQRYELNTDNGCIFNNQERIILPCRKNEFKCKKSRRCVPRWAVSDGFDDCGSLEIEDDDSDEKSGPYETCEKLEFRCNASGSCIPREWVMDGTDDCIDGQDETGPLPTCFTDEEFRCADSGQCLRRYRVMDSFSDCKDKTDESINLPTCNDQEFRCNDTGRCIPRRWMRDGTENCFDGSDELVEKNYTCSNGEFQCHNGRRCISEIYLCDGMDHCGDCSDEIESCHDEHMMWRCPSDPSVCFAQTFACDVVNDCPNGSDHMSFLPGFKCDRGVGDKSICAIPQWTLNGGFSLCADESDLCFSNGTSDCSYCTDPKMLIAGKQVCNDVVDCTDLTDECLCMKNENGSRVRELCESVCYGTLSHSCIRCSKGEILCEADDKCIKTDRLCNGVFDCPVSKIDEKFCTISQSGSLVNGTYKTYKCQALAEGVVDFLKRINVYDFIKQIIPDTATKCDGILECLLFDDECSADCPNNMTECEKFPLHHNIDFSTHINSDPVSLRTCAYFDPDDKFDFLDFLSGLSICNGIQQCSDGSDEVNCTGRHYCDAGTIQFPTGVKNLTSVSKKQICDLVTHCNDASDEMNCPNASHFYCYGSDPLYVRSDVVMDGKQDCKDNSDECPTYAYEEDAFSSREEMIRSNFLRYIIWIMATLSVVGNALVIAESYIIEFHSKQASSPISRCNRVLIVNLALSDFIMGIALLAIAIKSAMLSGDYCLQEHSWRISNYCSMIGILVVMSSETSVFTLIALTCYRLYAMFNPFSSRNANPKLALWVAAGTWVMSVTLALIPIIPVLNHTMITHALIDPSHYFRTTMVTWEEVHKFAVRLFELGSSDRVSAGNPNNWVIVEKHFQKHYSNIAPKIRGYFGYYSADGVCIPRLFRRDKSPPLHPLSLFVIFLNFTGLVFIIVAYCVIYRRSIRSGKNVKKSSSQDSRAKKMQRKIAALVATDICCWLPICIMSFISLTKVPLPAQAYAFSAILLLPINSSLNPIIYSNGFEFARGFIRKTVGDQKCYDSSHEATVQRKVNGKPDKFETASTNVSSTSRQETNI